ncbi:hypothetical protein BER93_15275 [Xanthomonas fragariae]|nr:hypothetical protein BER93_15275 [Xanthomonas fragariae]
MMVFPIGRFLIVQRQVVLCFTLLGMEYPSASDTNVEQMAVNSYVKNAIFDAVCFVALNRRTLAI